MSHRGVAKRGIRRVGPAGELWEGRVEGTHFLVRTGTVAKPGAWKDTALASSTAAYDAWWSHLWTTFSDGYDTDWGDGDKFDAAATEKLSAGLDDKAPEAKLLKLVASGANPNGTGQETAPWQAAQRGYLKLLRALAEAGADLDRPNSSLMSPGFQVPLEVAVQRDDPELIALLLELGASPHRAVEAVLDNVERALADASGIEDKLETIEWVEDTILPALAPLVAAGGDPDQRIAALTPRLDRGALEEEAAALEELGTAKGRKQPGWADRVESLLRPMPDGEAVIGDVCGILYNAIGHPDWARLVRAVIRCSPRFEDVAKEVYGHEVAFDDDEGPLVQGWDERYSSLPALIEKVLANKKAMKQPEFMALLGEVVDRAEATRFAPEQLAALLRKKDVAAMKGAAALKARVAAMA